MKKSPADASRRADGLHIAFVVIADLPQGGGHTARMERMIQVLSGLGHKVTVWNEHALGTTPAGWLQSRGVIGGGNFEFVLGKTDRGAGFGILPDKLRAVKAIGRRMRAAAQAGRLDVVFFNSLTFYDTYPLTRLAKRLGVATVQCYEDERLELVSNAEPTLSRRLFGLNAWLADRWCPRMADAIIVISHYLMEKYVPLSRGVPVKHVPTVIDCDAWQCPPDDGSDCPTLLYAGTFGEQDEMDHLIEALALLRDRGNRFRVLMLGENHRDPSRMRAIDRAIDQWGLSGIVDRRGHVSLAAVRLSMEKSAILLNLRRDGIWSRSGLSTKLSEYLASGRLVLASAVGEVPRYLRDGESALLVSSRVGVVEVADALERALGSLELRRKIGQNGQAVARRHFDTRVAAGTMEYLLRTILKVQVAAPKQAAT